MPSLRLPRVQPGDEFTTDLINSASDALMRQRLIAGSGIFISDKPTGQVIGATIAAQPGFWATFTDMGSPASDGKPVPYAWKEQVPKENGEWEDGDGVGSVDENPAYEVNGNLMVPTDESVIAWVEFNSDLGKYFFAYGYCTT